MTVRRDRLVIQMRGGLGGVHLGGQSSAEVIGEISHLLCLLAQFAERFQVLGGLAVRHAHRVAQFLCF